MKLFVGYCRREQRMDEDMLTVKTEGLFQHRKRGTKKCLICTVEGGDCNQDKYW
jgi:hypothetical protein